MNEIEEFWRWFAKTQDHDISIKKVGVAINQIGDKMMEIGLSSSHWDINSDFEKDSIKRIYDLSFTIDSDDELYLKLAADLCSQAPNLKFWNIHFGVPPKKNWEGSFFFPDSMESLSVFNLEFECRHVSDENMNAILLRYPAELNRVINYGGQRRIVEQSLIRLIGEQAYFNKNAPKIFTDESNEESQKINIHQISEIFLKLTR